MKGRNDWYLEKVMDINHLSLHQKSLFFAKKIKMEPIPYYFETINRNAILVRPKKPLYEWLNKIFPQDRYHQDDREDHNIYLIREMINNDEVKSWVRINYDTIFQNELNDWYTDSDKWPKNRSYELFEQWFHVEVHSMLLDLEEEEVIKE